MVEGYSDDSARALHCFCVTPSSFIPAEICRGNHQLRHAAQIRNSRNGIPEKSHNMPQALVAEQCAQVLHIWSLPRAITITEAIRLTHHFR
jgi:hypothetical protein